MENSLHASRCFVRVACLWAFLVGTHPLAAQVPQGPAAASVDVASDAKVLELWIKKTRVMPPDEQFEALIAWVLPHDGHPEFRLDGAWTAADEVPLVNSLEAARIDSTDDSQIAKSRRQVHGGELFAPVFDLVAIAKKLSRLEELETRVGPASSDDPVAFRAQLTLQFLIANAQRDFDKAIGNLLQLRTRCAQIPRDAPLADRWPELIACDEAIRHRSLRNFAFPILKLMVEQQQASRLPDDWSLRVRGLRDRCRALIETNRVPIAGGLSPQKQWTAVRIESASAHGRGPISGWNFHEDGVDHIAGDGDSYLYFQSPLRGTFRVEAQVATYGERETRLMYDGQWVGPHASKSMVELGDVITRQNGPTLDPALEFNDWCVLALEVDRNKATYYVDDRRVYQQQLPTDSDPWLALMSPGNSSGGARMIRITGSPEIPEELHLSSRTDLAGWAASLFAESKAGGPADVWIKSGSEIIGRKCEPIPGRKRQSLLRYHRPLAGDAVVKYDFFYQPGKTHVHPALGRTAFLFGPGGVELHWLTDAEWDRGDLAPDNTQIEGTYRRGPKKLPLKPGDWNHIDIRFVADTVHLSLNDVEIYEFPIEYSNQRQFGLFHHADETEVRVKNVTYRGDWPKMLPGLNEQELANFDPEPDQFADGELQTQFQWDFRGPQPTVVLPWREADPNKIEPVETGRKITRAENADEDGTICGFRWYSGVMGDYEITLGYRDFLSKTKQTDGNVPRIDVVLDIGAWGNNTNVLQCGVRRPADGNLVLYSGHGNRIAEQFDWRFTHHEAKQTSGRIRFTRRGHTACYWHIDGDSDDWKLLYKGPVSAERMRGVSFALKAETPTASGEIVITDFTVKSRSQDPATVELNPYEFAEAELSTRLSWDFQGLKPRFLNPKGAVIPNRLEPVLDGMKIVRAENAKADASECGFRWTADVTGDFQMTFSYRDFQSTPAKSDDLAPRVELALDIGGQVKSPENTHILRSGLRNQSDSRLMFYADTGTHAANANDWKHALKETHQTSGRIRIIRKGQIAYFLHSRAGSDNWKFLGTAEISAAPLKGGSIMLNVPSQASSAEVVFTEFELKTKEAQK